MSEVKLKRGRPRTRPFTVDEVKTAEALVAFYEQRLDEALARLGAAIEAKSKKRLSGRGV